MPNINIKEISRKDLSNEKNGLNGGLETNRDYKNKEIGRQGETLACQYLEQLGYEIIKRNHFDKVGEIDIIAYKDFVIHFVEVKTITREVQKEVIRETFDDGSYNPAEKIDKIKVRKMEKVAERFLFENGLEEEATQFDLICLTIYDGGFKYKIDVIEHINVD